MEDKITLDRIAFRALASDTRVSILKKLLERRKTGSELAKELGISVQAASEHLERLAEATLVKKNNQEGRKWVYYELTEKGRNLLEPQQTRKSIFILLGVSVLAIAIGSYNSVLNLFSPAKETTTAVLNQASVSQTASSTVNSHVSTKAMLSQPELLLIVLGSIVFGYSAIKLMKQRRNNGLILLTLLAIYLILFFAFIPS